MGGSLKFWRGKLPPAPSPHWIEPWLVMGSVLFVLQKKPDEEEDESEEDSEEDSDSDEEETSSEEETESEEEEVKPKVKSKPPPSKVGLNNTTMNDFSLICLFVQTSSTKASKKPSNVPVSLLDLGDCE